MVITRGSVQVGHDAVFQFPDLQSSLRHQGREPHLRWPVQRTGRSVGYTPWKVARRAFRAGRQPRRSGPQGALGAVQDQHRIPLHFHRRTSAVLGLSEAGATRRADVDRPDQEAGKGSGRRRTLSRLRDLNGKCQFCKVWYHSVRSDMTYRCLDAIHNAL